MIEPDRIRAALSAPLPGDRARDPLLPRGRPRRPLRPVSPSTRAGAVLIALTPRDGDLEFPLIERTDDGGPHARQISLPGGATESHDRGAEDTALREAREEIAYPVDRVTILGRLSPLFIDVSDFLITPVVGWLAPADPDRIPWRDLQPHPHEVAEIVRGSVTRCRTTLAERPVSVRGFHLSAPSFLAEDRVVWGATAMMLAELLAVLKSAEPR